MSFSKQHDHSEASRFVESLESFGKDGCTRVLDALLAQFTNEELAAIAEDWSFWARSKQFAPPGAWKTWGNLTGRAFGKTVAVSNHVNEEAESGRAMLICLVAQDEQSAIDVQVLGPSGLIATAPRHFKPVWHASDLQLVWPNGARAYVRTPEVPGKIRGLEYHLAWICELQSWPKATLAEAFTNVFYSTRLGYARIVWDATPKRRHPLLKELLARHEANPSVDVVVRGTTHENAANLGDGYVADMERRFGGTQKGREELLGEMIEDTDDALVKQSWIDEARRHMPERIANRVISIDPAVTNRPGSDTTGIVDFGVGFDGQGFVFGNYSGRYDISNGEWIDKAIDLYLKNRCSLIIAETNKGGQVITHSLRAVAAARGLTVTVVAKDERPSIVPPNTIYVKEVYAKGAKAERAEPVATAYERRRISHVIGADLAGLEDTLTTWEPTPHADSPGDLDALVHAAVELLRLNDNRPDAKAGFRGLESFGRELLQPPAPKPGAPTDLSLLFAGGNSDRI